MKKLLCLILSAVLLALTGCGAAEPPAAETPAETAAPAGTAVPEVSPSPAEEPDALPESFTLYYDAAETGGATAEGDERPYSPLADGGVSESYSLRLPDGGFEALLTQPFGEGITLEDFSGGGAERLRGVYTLAWNGEKYYSFGIRADNCAVPNLSPDVGGGILRLDIEGDCRVNGGGEEFGTFVGFDCVLITGSGTLTVENTSGLELGGGSLPIPALVIDGDVEVFAENLFCTPNENCALSAAVLRGALHAGRLEASGGDLLVSDGLLLARTLSGVSNAVFRGGTALLDDVTAEAPAFLLSGGAAYLSGDIPAGTVIEAGAGTLSAGNLAAATVNDYGAAVLDRDTDGSRYYATVYSTDWADESQTVWDALRVDCVGEQYWFAGALKLQNAEPPSLIPWGAAHIVLSGENRITENLGGASLVFSGDGSLTAEKDAGVWGWGAVHAPVVAVLGGASVTVQCEEFAVGSESGGEGLFLVDGGSFTAEHNLWLQNAVLEVRSGTLHIQGDLAMERGKIIVSGGELLVEGSVWLGEGDVIVSGGELVIPGGKDALALDAGTLTLTGGAVREP